MNIQTGEVRAWDLLTDEEKASGKWILIPDSDGIARLKTFLDDLPTAELKNEYRERAFGEMMLGASRKGEAAE